MPLFLPSLFRALDSDANPITGATWSFYTTGTLDPLAVYDSEDLDVSLGSVLTSQSGGYFPNIAFLDGANTYRAILKDASGNTLRDVDPYNGEGQTTGHVANATEQEELEVQVGDSVHVDDFAGGLFYVESADSVLATSTIVLRFIPHVYTNTLTVSGTGTAADTLTINGHLITVVASGATGQQINVGTDAADFAKNILSYVNRNLVTIGARTRGTTAQVMYANAAGPSGALVVSESSTALAWTSSTFTDPAIDTSLVFDDHAITFKASGATGQQVNIGASPSTTAQNVKTYIDANAETLGFTCAIVGAELTLTPTTTAGLTRLRNVGKGATGCPFFVVQEMNKAAVDRLSALYRLSVASPNTIHVRAGFDERRELHPEYWGIYGDDRDEDDILDPMQAMSEAAHWTGYSIELQARANYDITTASASDLNGLFWRDITVNANGATITNNGDYDGDGTPATRNSCVYIGVGHPAFEANVAIHFINAGSKGDDTVSFVTAADADHYRVNDVIPLCTAAGRAGYPNWHPEARDMYRITAKAGGTITLDRGLAADYPANSFACMYMGIYDSTVGGDVYIADRTVVRGGLNLYTPLGGAQIHSQPYDCDLEFGNLDAFYGIYMNSVSGVVRAKRVRCKERGIELAQNSQSLNVFVEAMEWWPNTVSDAVPFIKVGENGRDWVVVVRRMLIPDGFPGTSIISIVDGANGNFAIENSRIVNMTGKTFFFVQNTATPTGESETDFEHLRFNLGLVTYVGVPTQLISIQNNSGGVENLYMSGGVFFGPEPYVAGCIWASHSGGIADSVIIPGKLRVNGNNGVFRGYFSKGYDAASTGSGDVQITSAASAVLRKVVTSSTPYQGLSGAGDIERTTVAIPQNGLAVGDAFTCRALFTTTGAAGTKNIDLYDATGELASIQIPATAQTGIVEIVVARSASTSLAVYANIGGQTVVDNAVITRTAASMDGTSATGTLTFSGVGTAGDTITVNGHVITLVASDATGQQVNIGASASATAQAVKTYMTTNRAACGVSVSGAAEILTLTANFAGTDGNAIATTETSTACAFGAATLSGGADGGIALSLRRYVANAADSITLNHVRFNPLKIGHLG